jgi:hypothetical protein
MNCLAVFRGTICGMARKSDANLLEQITHYEFMLIRIADKPREYRELAEHLGKMPPNESVDGAYATCARLAMSALKAYHPKLKEKDLKRLDWEERQARGVVIERPAKRPSRKATEKARARRVKKR